MAECGRGSVIAHRLRALFCSTQVNLTMRAPRITDRHSPTVLQTAILQDNRDYRG